MKKMFYHYEDSSYEMLREDELVVIKDRSTGKFFESRDVEALKDLNWLPYDPKFTSKNAAFLLITLVVFLLFNFVFYFLPQTSLGVSFLLALIFVVYTVIQTFFHELSHIFALSKMGRKYSKIGMKMNYIFPSFYVRMNDIYLLTRNERLFVHSAGLLFNTVSNGICILIATVFHIGWLQFCTKTFFVGIAMNTCPILNSDGYKIMITLGRYNEKKCQSKAPIMIKIVGCVNVIVSVLHLLRLIGITTAFTFF